MSSTVFVEIRMLKDAPAIVGTDMNTYGPFVKDRVYAIPKENARIFLKLGLAVATRREAEKPTLKQMFKGEVLNGYVEAAKIKPLGEESGPNPIDINALYKRWVRRLGEKRINLKFPSLQGLYQWFLRECKLKEIDPEAIDFEMLIDSSLTYAENKQILADVMDKPLTDKEADVMYEEFKALQEKQVREKYPELVEKWTGKIVTLEREVTRGKKRLKKIKELEHLLAESERLREEEKAKPPEVAPVKIRVLKGFSEGIMDYVVGQVVETRNVDWVLDKVQKGFAERVGVEVPVTPPPKELTEEEKKKLSDVFKAVLFKELGKVPANALALFRVEMERIKMTPYEEAKTAVETLAKGIITREAWRKRGKVAKPPPPRVVRVGVPPEPRLVVGIPPAYPPSEPDPEAVPFPRAPSSRERVDFEKAFRYRLQERGISYFEYMKKFEDYIVRTVFKNWKHMLEMFDLFTDAIIKGERLPPLRLWKGVPVPYGLRPLLRAEAEITETYETMLEAEEARDRGRPDYEFVRIEPEPEITVVWRSTKPFRELIEPVQYNSIVKAATVVLKNAKFFRKTPTLKDIRVKLEEEFGIIATEQDIKDIVRDAWKNKELLPVPWFSGITLEELDELFKT
ncbi:hypothetical protein ES702_02206 [subsurface metagenome]